MGPATVLRHPAARQRQGLHGCVGQRPGQAVVILRMLVLVDELAQKPLISREFRASGYCQAFGRQFFRQVGLKGIMGRVVLERVMRVTGDPDDDP